MAVSNNTLNKGNVGNQPIVIIGGQGRVARTARELFANSMPVPQGQAQPPAVVVVQQQQPAQMPPVVVVVQQQPPAQLPQAIAAFGHQVQQQLPPLGARRVTPGGGHVHRQKF